MAISEAVSRSEKPAPPSPDAQVRAFLGALRDRKRNSPEAPGIDRILHRLAWRAVPWLEEGDPEELVSEFVLRMLQKKPDALERDVEKLLALDAKRLAGALAHRLRQIGAEHAPRWGLRKALREHVRDVWDRAVPGSTAMPSTLLKGEKLCRRHILAAVRHLRGQPDSEHLDDVEISERLLAQFFPEPEELDATPSTGEALVRTLTSRQRLEDDVRRRKDARTLARHFQKALGPDLTDVLARKLRGDTLDAIARARGLKSPASAFARLEAAQRIVAAVISEHYPSLRTARLALEEVGQYLTWRATRTHRRGVAFLHW